MEEQANQWKQDNNKIMDKNAKPSVTTVTDLDTQQKTTNNQRRRKNHKDVSSVVKKDILLQSAEHLNK